MKAFRLMMMAGLLAFAGAANAQEVTVLTAADIQTDADGKANLEIKMDFETTETIIGLNFSLTLPEGVDIYSKKTEFASDDELNAAKTSSCKVSTEVFEQYYDKEAYNEAIQEGDFIAAAGQIINYLTVKKRAEGGYLLAFIDQKAKTPFVSTHGLAVTVPLIANPATAAGSGKIFNIGMSNQMDQGFATFGNGATIADAVFNINADTDGINEVKAGQDNGAIYNVAGQRLDKAAKGLYIQNGKKYVK